MSRNWQNRPGWRLDPERNPVLVDKTNEGREIPQLGEIRCFGVGFMM
jgi:hypothetical protein